MHRSWPLVGLAVVLSFLSPRLVAQFDINGPNASLLVNGSAPSVVSALHDVGVSVNSYVDLTFDSGVNPFQGIIVLASTEDPDGIQHFATPFWGGSIDVGNGQVSAIQVIADGIGHSVNPTLDTFFRTGYPTSNHAFNDLNLSLLVPPAYCNGRLAMQAILSDPANGPFFLDNTECADLNFTSGVASRVLPLPDDGVEHVVFEPGYSFPFHGVEYTEMYVASNGWVTFGPNTNPANGVDFAQFMTGAPGIAVWINDWNPSAAGGVSYSQNGTTAMMTWGNAPGTYAPMPHATNPAFTTVFSLQLRLKIDTSVDPCGVSDPYAGEFSTYINLDDAFLETIEGTNGLTGHTPGGAAMYAAGVTPASRDISGAGAALTTGTAVPVIEEHLHSLSNIPISGYDGLGSRRAYNHFGIWKNTGFFVAPQPVVTPGQYAYSTTMFITPEQDLRASSITSFAGNPGTVVTVIGKFRGFMPLGTIELPTVGGGTVLATNIAVTGGNGPIFNNERLTFVVPSCLTLGAQSVTFHFPAIPSHSEKDVTVPVLITAPGVNVHPALHLGDDSSVFVATTVPVRMYGTNYQGFFLNSNGSINMLAGDTSFFPTMASFFAGANVNGNAGVAYCATDMNPGGIAGASTWTVTEDSCQGTVNVTAANQEYWDSMAPAGTFSVTFGAYAPDSVRFDFTGAVNDVGNPSSPIVGYGDGIAQGFGYDLDMGLFGGMAHGFNSSLVPWGTYTPMSIAFQVPSNTFATTMTNSLHGGGVFTVLNDGAGFLYIF